MSEMEIKLRLDIACTLLAAAIRVGYSRDKVIENKWKQMASRHTIRR